MQILKFIIVLFLILAYSALSFLLALVTWDPWRLRRIQARTLGLFCRVGLSVMGIRRRVTGQSSGGPELVVANHLSYLDILILAAERPLCFVTSVEIRETPGLGFLTQLGGCLYVERRNRSSLGLEIEEISRALKEGLSVAIFPEATSTNGEGVLRFRRPLFRAALEARVPVRPLCLNYVALNGVGVSFENRDQLFWYGDMDFLPHLFQLMGHNFVEVHVSVLPPLCGTPAADEADLAQEAHQQVAQAYRPLEAGPYCPQQTMVGIGAMYLDS